jgi:hypothetical protein
MCGTEEVSTISIINLHKKKLAWELIQNISYPSPRPPSVQDIKCIKSVNFLEHAPKNNTPS